MTLELLRLKAQHHARHAKAEIDAHACALRHGLHLTANACAERAHGHALDMRKANKAARAVAIAIEDSRLRRAFVGAKA